MAAGAVTPSAASYAGAEKAVYGPRKGHITGAISATMYEVFSGKGLTFADRDTLAARFAERGLSADQPVITYCGGGIAATVDAFALKLIGNDRVSAHSQKRTLEGRNGCILGTGALNQFPTVVRNPTTARVVLFDYRSVVSEASCEGERDDVGWNDKATKVRAHCTRSCS
jgi:rhodanese-related sulfurtransferase